MVHYVGLSGFRGQVPSYSEVHGAFETAVACLAERYNLEIAQLEKLSIDGHIGLDIEYYEHEYVEVLECSCDRVKRHTALNGLQGHMPSPLLFISRLDEQVLSLM